MAHSPDDALQKISKDRWRCIDGLVHAALEYEPTERAAFLEDACSGEDELRAEVESLLACDGREHRLFGAGAWPAANLMMGSQSIGFHAGTRLGEGTLVGLQVDRFLITG